jgi:hypothetical protein
VPEALEAPFWHFWHPIGWRIWKMLSLHSPTPHYARGTFFASLLCTLSTS